MYAVIVTGGKQYRVMAGETLRVEKLDIEAGNEVTFDNVLMLGDGEGVTLGDALKGATVAATVKAHGRADKIRIIKFRRRKHHMKRQGHGTIIALSSVAGQRVRRSNFVYGASKAGIDGFYLQLGEALKDNGVTVTVVRPGQVRTKMTKGLDEAPLTVNKEDVAEAAVDAALAGKSSVFVHKLFGPISMVLKAIPAPIMSKLNF